MTYPTHFAEGAKSVSGYAPQAAAAGAVTGAAINRFGFQSCVLLARAGAVTGTPTTQTLDTKLQDSADGTTGWADVAGAAITQITAANGEQHKNVDLTGARLYIRVASTVGFTGGTTPTLQVAATVTLGGAVTRPVGAY